MITLGHVLPTPPRLDELRAKAEGKDPAVLAELADELLSFSQSLDRHYDVVRAFEAAREGIQVLAQTEYAWDHDLTLLMDALVAEYLSISHRSRMPPDRKMLAPIAAALAHEC
jgi:hypothetical protein